MHLRLLTKNLTSNGPVDRIQKIVYAKEFTVRFVTSRGDAFQRLFEQLMSKRYPGDFMACKPWGRQGDQKNDGYLPSARTMFQVYAPNEFSSAETVTKINDDFAGAKDHWRQYFDRWVFVHNAYDQRLPPDVIKALADLKQKNPEITIEPWAYEELLIEFRQLDLAALQSWFGPAFSAEDKANLGFAELRAVIEHIKLSPTNPEAALRPVPLGKIEFNQLSPAVAGYLKLGMEKAPVVGSFFDAWRDPQYGSRIATAFTARYAELRDQMPPLHPDSIWGELEEWAGMNSTKQPVERLAIAAVLAWLFGNCDIFEEPTAGWVPAS